jgi:hypothetical protein
MRRSRVRVRSPAIFLSRLSFRVTYPISGLIPLMGRSRKRMRPQLGLTNPTTRLRERGPPAPGRSYHRNKLSLVEGKANGVEGQDPFSPNLELLADPFNGKEWCHDP